MDDPILWSSRASGSSFLGRNNEAVKIGDLQKNSEAVKVQAQVRQRVLSERSNPRRSGRVDTS